jgi:hypothetical protein
MKSLVATLLKYFLAAVLLVTLSNQVANACLQIIHAKDRRGDMECFYTGADADWCYYDCTCSGNCNALYDEFGLESY